MVATKLALISRKIFWTVFFCCLAHLEIHPNLCFPYPDPLVAVFFSLLNMSFKGLTAAHDLYPSNSHSLFSFSPSVIHSVVCTNRTWERLHHPEDVLLILILTLLIDQRSPRICLPISRLPLVLPLPTLTPLSLSISPPVAP